MWRKDYLGAQRRKYIRLNSVFPVQFRLVALDGKRFLSGWLQGFTNNIGKGGICLSVNNLNLELAQLLKNQQAKLSLDIEMPVTRRPIPAQARVAWMKDAVGEANKYFIGLSYEEINPGLNHKIMRYAWMRKLFVPAVSAIILILGLGFTINSLITAKLIQGNRALVGQLVKILQESGVAKQKIKEIDRERQDLQLKIHSLKLQLGALDEERALKDRSKTTEIQQLNSLIEKLTQEKESLEEQLMGVQRKESSVTEDLLRLDKKKSRLQKENLDKMYLWLKIHQNPRTGLVMSFEGDKDIENWAFTYDQALVIQAYSNFSDFERAKKILDFFLKKAKRIDGRFINAYYVNDGSPAEYMVHSGPNIWLGIAAVQYTKKAKDYSYLQLAEEIASAIIQLQRRDSDGGIRGGPNVTWFSTEHNLDAYAFFHMLYQVTRKPKYQEARDRALDWLVKHTYDKVDVPIKRGKGDSTIATDTYAWSIAAIGPEKLEELGMEPERIVEFAEQNCSIEASFIRPEGETLKVKGFDFAPSRHVARGGVVSSEWTAQMVLAFKLMADFYYQKNMVAKARSYELKVDTYLAELSNMIISSPSPSGQGESCLPYATQDYVDTGHGWMTPKGSSTGSVAGTAYTLFAYYNYNPLELKE